MAITAGASRVASGLLCLHAIAIIPAGPMELVRSSVSIVSGLPCEKVRSAPAIVVSGPAQRLLTLWPARSRSRLATLSIESFDSLVAYAAVSIATGWSEPVPGVGIEPRRAHFVIQDRVTFPRAPLQSRKVGFPDSGFDLGFSREVFPKQAKLKCSLTCTSTYSGLPRSSSLESWLLRLESLTIPRTAKCPELLCPSQALLMMGWCPAPPRRALLLLPRSYEAPNQFPPLEFMYPHLSPEVRAGCCEPLLETGSSRRYLCQCFSGCLSHGSRRVAGCVCLFLPLHRRPSPTPAAGSAFPESPRKETSCGGCFEIVAISYVQASWFARHPGLPYRYARRRRAAVTFPPEQITHRYRCVHRVC